SFTVAAARVPGATTCARLAINFAARTAPLVGLAATFAPRTLVLRPRRGTGPSTGEVLCAASTAVAANAPPAITVHLLNALRLQCACCPAAPSPSWGPPPRPRSPRRRRRRRRRSRGRPRCPPPTTAPAAAPCSTVRGCCASTAVTAAPGATGSARARRGDG